MHGKICLNKTFDYIDSYVKVIFQLTYNLYRVWLNGLPNFLCEFKKKSIHDIEKKLFLKSIWNSYGIPAISS